MGYWKCQNHHMTDAFCSDASDESRGLSPLFALQRQKFCQPFTALSLSPPETPEYASLLSYTRQFRLYFSNTVTVSGNPKNMSSSKKKPYKLLPCLHIGILALLISAESGFDWSQKSRQAVDNFHGQGNVLLSSLLKVTVIRDSRMSVNKTKSTQLIK